MNPGALLCLGLAGAAMLTDWWSVSTSRSRVEGVAKPLVMLALIVAAVLIDMNPSSLRPLVITALAAGLLGDVMLLPQIDRFLTGLGAFLVGHIAYVAAFALLWDPSALVALGIVAVIILLTTLGISILQAVHASQMFIPVLVYVAVSAGLILVAAESGRWVIFVGACTFAVSDSILGYDRFVARDDQHRVLVHITYHLGQAAILVGTIA